MTAHGLHATAHPRGGRTRWATTSWRTGARWSEATGAPMTTRGLTLWEDGPLSAGIWECTAGPVVLGPGRERGDPGARRPDDRDHRRRRAGRRSARATSRSSPRAGPAPGTSTRRSARSTRSSTSVRVRIAGRIERRRRRGGPAGPTMTGLMSSASIASPSSTASWDRPSSAASTAARSRAGAAAEAVEQPVDAQPAQGAVRGHRGHRRQRDRPVVDQLDQHAAGRDQDQRPEQRVADQAEGQLDPGRRGRRRPGRAARAARPARSYADGDLGGRRSARGPRRRHRTCAAIPGSSVFSTTGQPSRCGRRDGCRAAGDGLHRHRRDAVVGEQREDVCAPSSGPAASAVEPALAPGSSSHGGRLARRAGRPIGVRREVGAARPARCGRPRAPGSP